MVEDIWLLAFRCAKDVEQRKEMLRRGYGIACFRTGIIMNDGGIVPALNTVKNVVVKRNGVFRPAGIPPVYLRQVMDGVPIRHMTNLRVAPVSLGERVYGVDFIGIVPTKIRKLHIDIEQTAYGREIEHEIQ